MRNIISKFTQRGKEPSTWASLSVILAVFGLDVGADSITQIGLGLTALLGVVLPEQKD